MADSTAPSSLLCGLINAANRYLTAEPFRFQVVATGSVLRPRQVWGLLGQGEEGGQRLHLLSALQRFLAADPNGKVTCDQESPGPGALFLLRQYPDGKVSLQCELSQRYLGGAEDNVTCFAQTVGEGEKWSLHLAQHPNVHLLNPGKQRYVRCDQQTGHLRCDRDLPWGPDALITLHFDLKEKKYGLQTGAGSLLAADGTLQAEPSPHTLYSLELRGSLLALRYADGRYLTGREGTVKAFKTDKPGRDELFALEPSMAQVSLRTCAGGRFISCRPGKQGRVGNPCPRASFTPLPGILCRACECKDLGLWRDPCWNRSRSWPSKGGCQNTRPCPLTLSFCRVPRTLW
uniref:Fascin-like domain-containing protein n=1 Tax=Pelusios castaneus TaxID=367368 RepID=A0A8C8RW76_9SAUR